MSQNNVIMSLILKIIRWSEKQATPINSSELSPSSQADISLANPENSTTNTYCVHKTSIPIPILRQIHPVLASKHMLF
jgi:hypothetical protein